eukprot:4725675-Pleurochrysis_carterae.AAC.1
MRRVRVENAGSARPLTRCERQASAQAVRRWLCQRRLRRSMSACVVLSQAKRRVWQEEKAMFEFVASLPSGRCGRPQHSR